ncbi:MAG: alpha/beta hydrolase-fold protein [Anaerolineae bacterium]
MSAGAFRTNKSEYTAYENGRLTARPSRVALDGQRGLHRLGLDDRRDGWLYVPATYRPNTPAPLVLMLHGAGGGGEGNLWPLRDLADWTGMILVGPDSRRETWDVIYGEYGADVAFIDYALEQTFSHYAVDPQRVAVEGFSDGASYALSLGMTNGDLFSDIVAFSPGFMAPASQTGAPRVYVSHGVRDEVLPIASCSRRLVPLLRRADYEVTYHEFDDGHTVPPAIAQDAVRWFAWRGE